MKAPVYIYYQLDNYHQNHRRQVACTAESPECLGAEAKARACE